MPIYLRKRDMVGFDGPARRSIYFPGSMAAQPNRRDPFTSGNPWSGMAQGWAVTAYLLGGIAVWGGVGYVIDRIIGFHWLFLPIGMIGGVLGGMYLVYVRYGMEHGDER
jgi:ATP synthase protein I